MKPKANPKTPAPPFKVRRERPELVEPEIVPVYARVPREELDAFREWMRKNGVPELKTGIRFAMWYIVNYEIEPPPGE